MDKIPEGKKKLSKNSYRNQVVSKLKGISRTILDMSIPFAVDVAVETVCKVIEEKLHIFYKNTTINSLITLALNIIGLLLVLFYPFGKTASKIFAILIFLASGIFSLIRCVKFVKKYGKSSIDMAKNIWKEKSIPKGIETYVFSEFPAISMIFAGIDFATNYCSQLKQVPKFNETIKFIIRVFWKKLALFLGLLSIYLILFYGIVKPFILVKYF